MNQLSDTTITFLLCGLPLIVVTVLGLVALLKPEWYEWLAGEKRPMVKKGRRK